LALYNNQIAGYVFLYYECKWGGLKNQGLPSVVDLIVFEAYRRKGIATALMDFAEREARSINSKIYLDVCLNSEYGPAQCFYIRRGYVPDGAGVYYEQEVLSINSPCFNDDELTLCLVKKL
jgi:GNAT superfamily N-acetyltransferase